MKKYCFMWGALLVSITLLTGCGKKDSGQEIRIGYFPNITHSQAMVMKEQQVLENELGSEYKVEWLSFQAGPAEVEAIFAGEVDIGYIGPVPAINAFVKSKGDVVIIANACDAGAVLLASEGSGIESVKDLEGKKAAIPQIGNTQHLNLLQLLDENNMSAVAAGGTVEVQAVANADLQTLFEQGQLDAALVPEPWGALLQEKCAARVVLDYDEIMNGGNYPTAVVVVRKDFMEEHPEAVEKFIKAHLDSTEFVIENSKQAQEIVNRQIESVTGKKYDSAILEKAFSRLKMSAAVQMDSLELFAEIGLKEKFIVEMPSGALVDTSIMDKAGK